MDLPLWSLEDIEGLQELAGRARHLTDRYQNALVGTLNRTVAGARTDAVNMIRDAYHLLPGDVRRARKRFRIRRATFRKPVARLWVKAPHGVHVSERQPYAAWEGIKYSALHGRALVPGPRVFLGHGQFSGKLIVFRRLPDKLITYKGKRGIHTRQAVEAVYTASEMEFLGGSGREELLDKVRARLARDGRDQLDYYLRRIFDKRWGVTRSKA